MLHSGQSPESFGKSALSHLLKSIWKRPLNTARFGRFFVACMFLTISLTFIVSSTVPFRFAQAVTGVPEILSYQGRLTDDDGDLLGGSGTDYVFRFSIWDNSTVGSGTRLWPSATPGNATTTVTEGVFNINIGDTTNGTDALTYNFEDNDTVYLQVEVSSNGTTFETLSPRQQITSSGFAINANTVRGFVPAQSASGNQIPVLTSGSLILGASDPTINATGSNTLTLQSGVTGNIQFFSSSNNLTSAGTLTLAGGLNSNSATTTDTLSVGGTLRLSGGVATLPALSFTSD